jgi:hypothetical protein
MTVHNDKSHTIAGDTAAMISNTAAPAAPATYWHGRPLDDVRRQPPSNPCAPFGPLCTGSRGIARRYSLDSVR